MNVIIKEQGRSQYHIFEHQNPARYLTWLGCSAAECATPAKFTNRSDAVIFAECHGHTVVGDGPRYLCRGDRVKDSDEEDPRRHGTVLGYEMPGYVWIHWDAGGTSCLSVSVLAHEK